MSSRQTRKQKIAKANKSPKKRVVKVVEDTYLRPSKFSEFTDTVAYAKQAIYSITRIREVQGNTFIVTLGSGFLTSPNKLMTCSHVLKSIDPNVTPITNPMAFHKDGDTYYLLNKDPYDNDHFYRMTGRLGKNIHLYPDVDAAILTLDDDFYVVGKKILQHKDVYLPLSTSSHPLGLSVAVLGYPEEIDEKGRGGIYTASRSSVLNDSLIKKRVDRGVINARYLDKDSSVIKYDFTMAFNPGNSGGPIIDNKCNAIAIAHGYRAFPIKVLEEQFQRKKPDGTTENITLPATLRAIYSIGFSSENFETIISEHRLMVT